MSNSKLLANYKTWEQIKSEAKQYKQDHPYLSWFAENVHYPLVRLCNTLKSLPKEIKWFIQRGKRGWSDCDAWNFFSYNAKVCSEALSYLSKKPTGHPPNISYKRWKVRLAATSYLFDAIYRCDGFTPKQSQYFLKKLCRIIERDYYHWWD